MIYDSLTFRAVPATRAGYSEKRGGDRFPRLSSAVVAALPEVTFQEGNRVYTEDPLVVFRLTPYLCLYAHLE